MQTRLLCLLLLAGVMTASTALGQELGVRSYGLRGGININPDQFNFGAHVDAGTLASRVRFQPSFELGLGNGVTVAAANFDAHYLFTARRFRGDVPAAVEFGRVAAAPVNTLRQQTHRCQEISVCF